MSIESFHIGYRGNKETERQLIRIISKHWNSNNKKKERKEKHYYAVEKFKNLSWKQKFHVSGNK